MSTFGDRLGRILAEKGLTQDQLAKQLFVSAPTVSRWLDGAIPRRHTLSRLQQRLGISIDWLLHGRGEPTLIGYSPTNDTQRAFAEYLVEVGDLSQLFTELIS